MELLSNPHITDPNNNHNTTVYKDSQSFLYDKMFQIFAKVNIPLEESINKLYYLIPQFILSILFNTFSYEYTKFSAKNK